MSDKIAGYRGEHSYYSGLMRSQGDRLVSHRACWSIESLLPEIAGEDHSALTGAW